MASKLFAKKPIGAIMAEASETSEHSLKRALGPLNLITLGIGAIIGAGIFVLTGTAAAMFAGPAIVLSFVVAGCGCVFAGLCYAEFASMFPIAGSAYTYGYTTLGEIVAWIIGWALAPWPWAGAVTSRASSVSSACNFHSTPRQAFPSRSSDKRSTPTWTSSPWWPSFSSP
jgi:basic amino acid/polyamine antiporter, APA family